MNYEVALKRWGALQLGLDPDDTDLDEIQVRMFWDEGYACCGGTDPGCYCSLAEPPRAEVRILGPDWRSKYIDMDEFDFGRVLGQIVEAGGGHIYT